jgi:hypothetical protein
MEHIWLRAAVLFMVLDGRIRDLEGRLYLSYARRRFPALLYNHRTGEFPATFQKPSRFSSLLKLGNCLNGSKPRNRRIAILNVVLLRDCIVSFHLLKLSTYPTHRVTIVMVSCSRSGSFTGGGGCEYIITSAHFSS